LAQHHHRRLALIIASDTYTDSKLSQLKAPRLDAEKLEKILKDEFIGGGGYEVKVLYNKEANIILRDLEKLFKSAEKNDMILVYFAGHGHKSIKDSLLYLATIDSNLEYVKTTTIPARSINEFMQESRSSNKVLILDCCYSGAFARGMLSRSSQDKSVNLKEEFSDSGCVILTSTSAMQYAWEGSDFKKDKVSSNDTDQGIDIRNTREDNNNNSYSSIYTKYLIEGIETGNADLNEDGTISCRELHDYVKNKIREEGYPQIPEITMLKGDVIIANSITYNKISNHNNEIEQESFDSQTLLQLLQKEKIADFNNMCNTKKDIRLTFHGVDLKGKNLSNVDLHDVDLMYSILSNTNLQGANLDGAVLKGANLTDANLRAATLYKADLSESILVKCDLRGATLKGMIDFTNANLKQADLRGADLNGMVNFERAILDDANFTGANINTELINFKDASKINCKGLSIPQKQQIISTKYTEAMNAFSKFLMKKVTSNDRILPKEELKPLEDVIKEITKSVEKIADIENLDENNIKELEQEFVKVAKKILKILPINVVYESFGILWPFRNIINNAICIVEQEQQEDKEKIKNIDESCSACSGTGAATNDTQVCPTCSGQGQIRRVYQEDQFSTFISLETCNTCRGERKLQVKNCYVCHGTGKAKAYADKALVIDPNYKWVLASKGDSLRLLGKYDEAIKYFDKALVIDPNYKWVLDKKNKAIASKENDRKNFAESDNKKAGKENEKIDNFAEIFKDMGFGSVDEIFGKFFGSNTEENPKDANTWHNKGRNLFNLGKYEEAVKAYDEALKIDPKYTPSYVNKGISLEMLGRYKEAKDSFNKAKVIGY
jgi:uncharacterized protein YjbI with pentapeptide repeats/Tfp pilus assembly protein PilF